MSKVVIASGLALTLAAAGGLAWASQHGLGPGGGHCRFGQKFARLHVELMTDRVLRVAEATPEQRQQVEAILDKAFTDHQRFRDQHTSLRGQALEILSADVVDRGRIEELRARHVRMADQGSRHFATVLADVAEVLTPEQRQKLAAHAKQMLE